MVRQKKFSKFERVRAKSYQFYFKTWSQNTLVTPAFGQKVKITRSGWEHLTIPPKRRTKAELLERFRLLPLAKKLLQEASTYQEHRTDQFGHFFGLVSEFNGVRIKVIVYSRTLTSQKYFYSVMKINRK